MDACRKSTTMKHVYNESANFIETDVVDFVINQESESHQMVSVVDMDSTMSSAPHRYARVYLMVILLSLLSGPPGYGENWCHFWPKSTQSCYDK